MNATTEATTVASSSSLTLHGVASVDTAESIEEKRTMLRVDLRLIPVLGLIFAVTALDRTNFGLAFAAGMGFDLKLTVGNRYSLVASLHSYSYPIGEILGLLLIPLLGPRHLLALCVATWGLIQLSMGFITDWRWLALCRVLLGLVEGPLTPLIVMVISAWYTKFEVHRRVSIVTVMGYISSAFSPILVFFLVHLDGARGLHGWSWVFVIEGAITIGCGVLAFIFIPGFPHENAFLTPSQTQIVLKRNEANSVPDHATPKAMISYLKDWVLWAHGLMLFCSVAPAVAMVFFLPIILAGMGWSGLQFLLMSAPPYLFASITAVLFSWWSDKRRMRAPFIAIQVIMTLVGLIMTAFVRSNAVRYLGVFILVAGSNGITSAIVTYLAFQKGDFIGVNNCIRKSG
ncbi:hypothetical protein ONZ45_g3189 [Pleurotus djamor]|nr:hypothetical protein ONZ45_g3189 [Pleurotus djamor]